MAESKTTTAVQRAEETNRSTLFGDGDDLDGAVAHAMTPVVLSFPSSSGALAFVNKAANETLKEIIGIAMLSRITMAYYEGEYGGANKRPTCASTDGIRGNSEAVNPTLECAKCPKNRWGSGKNNSGKACREQRRLIIMVKRDELPIMLTIPVTSIRAWDAYCTGLRGSSQRYYSVFTRFSLAEGQSKAGIEFAKLALTQLKPLNDEQLAWVIGERTRFVPLLSRAEIQTEEKEEEESEDYLDGRVDTNKPMGGATPNGGVKVAESSARESGIGTAKTVPPAKAVEEVEEGSDIPF